MPNTTIETPDWLRKMETILVSRLDDYTFIEFFL
jgi:hypothetical protein